MEISLANYHRPQPMLRKPDGVDTAPTPVDTRQVTPIASNPLQASLLASYIDASRLLNASLPAQPRPSHDQVAKRYQGAVQPIQGDRATTSFVL
jgi:hypothetical protein